MGLLRRSLKGSEEVSQRFREVAQTIRIASFILQSSGIIYLIFSGKARAELRVTPKFSVGIQPEIEQWLLASRSVIPRITVLDSKPPTEIKTEKLLDLKMVLQVPTK